jgi:hypothetical protein
LGLVVELIGKEALLCGFPSAKLVQFGYGIAEATYGIH